MLNYKEIMKTQKTCLTNSFTKEKLVFHVLLENYPHLRSRKAVAACTSRRRVCSAAGVLYS